MKHVKRTSRRAEQVEILLVARRISDRRAEVNLISGLSYEGITVKCRRLGYPVSRVTAIVIRILWTDLEIKPPEFVSE